MPTSIRVLVGPNGAGKSTLLDTIIGHVRATEGKVIFKGEEITHMNEYRIVRKGICRKFQAPGILENLTVEDNLNLAAQQHRECHRSFGRGLSREVRERVEDVLEKIGLKDRRKALAGQLAHGQKQWLEIGMLLIQDPELLMLDEPVAGMSIAERQKTAALLNEIIRNRSVIVIEHDMKFVESIAHRVTVLHQGKVLAEGNMQSVQANPKVREVYLGH